MSLELEAYRKLTNELLFCREIEGGDALEGLEAYYQERLDSLWKLLSSEEREQFETDLANGLPVHGPEKLNLVDCPAELGSSAVVRKNT